MRDAGVQLPGRAKYSVQTDDSGVSLTELASEAMEVALELRHPVYDCCYLALAIQRLLPVITVDRRFIEVTRAHAAHAKRTVALSDFGV